MNGERRYTPTHEWIAPTGDGARMRVGITDFAQSEITDVVFVELPRTGKRVPQGGEAAIIESVKAAFSIYAPMTGAVAAVNGAIEGDPGLVNRDPFGSGWLFEVAAEHPEEWNGLLDEAGYRALLDSGLSQGGGH